jgi:hypothetical protein
MRFHGESVHIFGATCGGSFGTQVIEVFTVKLLLLSASIIRWCTDVHLDAVFKRDGFDLGGTWIVPEFVVALWTCAHFTGKLPWVETVGRIIGGAFASGEA